MRHIDDDGFNDFLQQLIKGEHLDGAALGITKKVIDTGEQSLSPQQTYVFKTYVLDEFITPECKGCGLDDIPWCEMYHAYDNGHVCNLCWHHSQKDDF